MKRFLSIYVLTLLLGVLSGCSYTPHVETLPDINSEEDSNTGRVYFDISESQYRDYTRRGVTPVVMIEEEGRKTFADFSRAKPLSKSIDFDETHSDGRLEISGLPIGRKLWLAFYRKSDKYARLSFFSLPLAFELTDTKAYYAGSFPKRERAYSPEGLYPLTDKEEELGWQEAENFDQSIEYELYEDGKRVYFDALVYEGHRYEIWLWEKGSSANEAAVKLRFTPTEPALHFRGQMMLWQLHANKNMQFLLDRVSPNPKNDERDW